MLVRVLAAAAVLAVFLLGPAPADAQVSDVRHSLTVHLDPDRRTLAVTDRVGFKGRGVVEFHLAAEAMVTTLLLNGRRVTPLVRRNVWTLRLPDDHDGRHELLLEYAANLRGLPADLRAVSPGALIADPEGSYLSPGAGWYPRFEVPTFAFDLTVTVPQPFRAVAPGRIAEEADGPQTYRARFESEHPIDGIVLMAGAYRIDERMHGGVRLRTYFPHSLTDLSAGYLDDTARYLDRYGDWIGAYPFSAFHVVAAPFPTGLGFPYLTYIGRQVLRLPFIRGSSLGHEILHSWWGNGVYPDYGSGNWAEGLTTFMADYTLALERSADEARDLRLAWLRDFAALPPERDRPSRSFTSKSHAASQVIGYDRVAFMFHMLRGRIGHQAFDAGVRRFWRDNRFRVAGWAEIEAAFEAESGGGLGDFFAQWLDRPGAPSIVLEDAKAVGSQVQLTISQDAEPPYRLSVPVVVETGRGSERFAVALDGARVTVSLAVEGEPRALYVDPDFDIFRRLAPDEAPPILRDVTLGTETAVMIAADTGADREAALALARRMLDAEARIVTAPPARGPLLVIGIGAALDNIVAALGLAPPPDPAAQGTALAWTARHQGRTVAVVKAQDRAALMAAGGPLPHYGRQSYVVFDGREAVARGVWPLGTSSLMRRLD